MRGKNERRTRRRIGRQYRTAKNLIAYEAMLPDGIAQLGDDEWSITMRLPDIGYVVASSERQRHILDAWAKLLNMFADGTRLQITCIMCDVNPQDVIRQTGIMRRDDGFDVLRDDLERIISRRVSSLSAYSTVRRYLTVTIRCDNRQQATETLHQMADMVSTQLSTIERCHADVLGRDERLGLLASMLRPHEPFTFADAYIDTGQATSKDFITPWCIDASYSDRLTFVNASGNTLCRILWIRDFPPVMSDRLIGELTSLHEQIAVSLHVTPFDRVNGEELIDRRIAEMEMQRIEERRRNMRQHLPAEEISADLRDALDEANALRDDMRESNERIMHTIVVIMVSARDEQELRTACDRVRAAARKASCTTEIMTYMQTDGLNAMLPLGVNPLPMRRTLTTSGVAILTPFTTREVIDEHGLFYGINPRSGNPVIADRTVNLNGNGLILGTTGSGKSQAAKMEMTSLFLARADDEILIVDPEHEYAPLCDALQGCRIIVSAGSSQRINPLDIVFDEQMDDDPIRTKTNAVIAMIGSLIAGTDGLSAVERSIIDRCVLSLYRETRNSRVMPTLADLQRLLLACDEPEARTLAVSLESYTTGSLSGFSGQTNVDTSNRFTVFDVAGLDGEIRTFGMMVVLDHLWNRVASNRASGRRTWIYVDEFHRMFSNRYAAEHFLDMFKRARKWGLSMTGITQNIEELLDNRDARLMLSNTAFLILMSQTPTDAAVLAEMWGLSPELRSKLDGARPGEGLIKTGETFIPLDGRIDSDSQLYRLFTTRFGET